MPPAVRTRRATAVALPDGPLPAPGRRVPLSPFDAYWVPLPPVRRVFLFTPPVPFPDVVRALKSSLATVLPTFHLFAGELAYDPDSRSIALVVREDGAGVAFVDAETEMELARLVEEYDVDALGQLVPGIHREELPAPVMAVQVTEFVAGGIAVGVALHHTAADGRGLWRFIQTWAAAAAGSPVSQLGTALHDRRLVHFQGDEDLANFFLKHVAPELPRIAPKQDALPAGQRPSLSRRTFTLPSSAVRRLKQQLATAPSTFAAVVAHGWVSIARAKGFTDDSPVYAFFLADLRAHMTPPVPDAYIGNCLAVCSVVLSGAELTGSDGPTRACSAIKDAVAEVKREPLADPRGWMSKFTEAPPGRGIVMAGSPWFPAYGIDFGFGKPARVELASMNHDGEMVLVAGKEPGSVQASVALSADKMPAFCEVFVVES
ncbi:hypothetical protein QOZ80_2AG0122000 [Eleusine coracana subsp. coracana]|nr:hypothetical protein QOZ80_2AG0122000 [Eleusine coracana subsp. coracana]